MNSELISKALCYHGQPLQKIWEGERGNADLYQLGVVNPNFSIYLERQKNLTFQDRAKRLKLHQFLARKATDLFNSNINICDISSFNKPVPNRSVAPVPPFEAFLNRNQDKATRWHCTLEAIKPGDIIYGLVIKPSFSAMKIKALCTGEPLIRYLENINIQAFISSPNMIPGCDSKGNVKNYSTNDLVCCEVLDISVGAERMHLGMRGVVTKNTKVKLGLISSAELPDYYRVASEITNEKYEDCLVKLKEFQNPNYDILFELNGIDTIEQFSLMKSLSYRFPQHEYAFELRQTQASKWAFRSVAEGIEHFKVGRHVEAFQCLNKALNIDPRNVEGLVARGALYANKGSFLKAVEDFETALKLNAFHTNARKYMGETLVALARSYEEDNQIDDAIKAYRDCLNIIPNHEQAKTSLEMLTRRPEYSNKVLGVNLVNIPGADLPDRIGKRRKKTKNKISNSSSTSSSGSSNSTSDSDSSERSSSAASDKEKPRAKLNSLSPLSKRMADMNPNSSGSLYEFSRPFHLANVNQHLSNLPPDFGEGNNLLDENEEDYESRVKKLLQEASKHKKDRSGKKKKDKKKRKKNKKSSLKTKFENEVEVTNVEQLNNMSFKDAYRVIQSMNIENKLSSNIEKYEKTIEEIKKRQENIAAMTEKTKLSTTHTINLHDHMISGSKSNEYYSRSTNNLNSRNFDKRSESPPPKAPSMRGITIPQPPNISNSKSNEARNSTAGFKPFPIKAPVVLDKFGTFRLAVPPTIVQKPLKRSTSRSISRSRSRSPYHSSRRRSKSPVYSKRTRSFSRSRSRGSSHRRVKSRYRSRRSRSRSHSASRYPRSRRRHSRSRSRSPRRRRSRSRSPRIRRRGSLPRGKRSRSPKRSKSPKTRNDSTKSSQLAKQAFCNRVWKRSNNSVNAVDLTSGVKSGQNISGNNSKETNKQKLIDNAKWPHDKFEKDDGPSLEEIDQIINQAQKQRKEEILQRDGKLLKKPNKA